MNKSAFEVYTTLNTGAKIPCVGFGTVCPPENKPTFKKALMTAIETGYRHIDTAWKYGTEPIIGEALKELFAKGDIKREDLFITTKVWPSLHDDPLKSLNKSLSDLGIDYVDLFLQHWPICFDSNEDGLPVTPTDEAGEYKFDEGANYWETYGKMVEIYKTTNKVKAIGVSNFTEANIENLLSRYDVVPAANQLELHPHLPQVELVKFCKEKNIVIEAYSPLGSSGAPNLKIPIVVELAEKHKVSPTDILISYHAAQGRCVLPRSQNLERIKKGYTYVPLSDEESKALDQFGIDNPKRYVNEGWGKNIGFEHWD